MGKDMLSILISTYEMFGKEFDPYEFNDFCEEQNIDPLTWGQKKKEEREP
jgi:hypothetical protein